MCGYVIVSLRIWLTEKGIEDFIVPETNWICLGSGVRWDCQAIFFVIKLNKAFNN